MRRFCRLLAAVVVLSSGCAATPLVPPPTGSSDRRLPLSHPIVAVPASAELVVAVDVAQLRDSPWTAPTGAALSAVRADRARARGFDELSDVDRQTFAILSMGGRARALRVAEGRFAPARILEAFEEDRLAAETSHGGVEMLGDDQSAIAFLDHRTLLEGAPDAVRAAIDTTAGRGSSVREADWVVRLRGALDEGRGRSARGAAVDAFIRVTPPVKRWLRSSLSDGEALERVGIRLTLGETLDLLVVADAPDAREAAGLAERLGRVGRDLRAKRALVNLGFQPLLEGLRITAQGARLRAELRLEDSERADLAERLAAVAAALLHPSPSSPP